jgi:hypothetical protein
MTVLPVIERAEFHPLGFPRSRQLKLSQAQGVKKILYNMMITETPHMTPCIFTLRQTGEHITRVCESERIDSLAS